MSEMIEMKTLTINETTFEIVDEKARTDINKLSEEIVELKEFTDNIFNSEWVLNADIRTSTGVFRENTGSEYIAEKEFYKVTPNTDCILKTWKDISHTTSAQLIVFEYSNNDESSFVSTQTIQAETDQQTYIFTPTQQYVRFLLYGANRNNVDFYPKLTLLRLNSIYDEYEPYYKLKNTMYNVLYGKNIVSTGDSVAFGAGYVNGYVGLIAERNGMGFLNYGHSGWTMATGFIGDGICTIIDTMDISADYVLIEGGQNDWYNNVPLGEITNDMTSSVDKNTFYGALEHTFQRAIFKFYKSKIVYVLHHKHKKSYCTQNGIGLTEQEYIDAIIKTCNKYGIKIANVWDESHFNTEYAVYNQYTMLITNNGETYGDGTHPNKEGYLRYYVPIIENAMRSI